MTGGELNATQIHALLHELGRRLQDRGVHGDVKLIGGAALILQGIGNRPTADIAKRGEDKNSMMPIGLMNNCSAEELAAMLAYFESLVK